MAPGNKAAVVPFSERLRRTAWGLGFKALGIGDIVANAAMPFVLSNFSVEEYLVVALFVVLGTIYAAFGLWILTTKGDWRRALTVSLWGAAAVWALFGGLLLVIEGGSPGSHDPLYRYFNGGRPPDITYAIGTVVMILLALVMALIGYRKMIAAWRGTGPADDSEARK
jgi:hypothetical protein